MKTLKIKKGTILHRVETKEKRKDDNPKFYSYFRDDSCDKKTWAKRCVKYCRYLEVKVKKDLKLLVVPYKTILYMEDVTKEDRNLAEILVHIAKRVYKGDKKRVDCVRRAVSDLILLKEDDKYSCESLLNDWTIATLICEAGFDGMVRFVEGNVVNCYDEVAICFPDEKLEVVKDEMLKV